MNTASIFKDIVEISGMSNLEIIQAKFSNPGKYITGIKTPTFNTMRKFCEANGIEFAGIIIKDTNGREINLKFISS